MADVDRIAAALRYQQEMDSAQRPATMNPNIAAQGATGRALVAPPTSVMDERYPAWKKSQDDAENLINAAEMIGAAIPLAGPAVKGAAALGRYAGPELARGLENYMIKTGGILPLDVYHGTPHRFPPTAKNPLGEFDALKIGTGEGAQAYGHGLYLAENPAVSNEYRRTLRDMNPSYDGVPINNADTVKKTAAELLMKAKGDKAAAIKDAQNYAFDNLLIPEINKMDASKVSYGQLYKVDLPDEQIAKMLDWDKPLSQQPQLKEPLDKFTAEYGLVQPSPSMTGKQYYQALEDYTANTSAGGVKRNVSEDVSGLLRQYGIPGIRYLDQGSRAAPSSAQFVKADVVGAADDLTALAKSMGLDAEVRHSGSNAGKSSYVSVFDPMTNRYIKSSFRISDHGTGPLRHQEHIHINSPADLAAQKNDLFEWVKRNRTEKGVDTTDLSAPSQGTSNFVVFDPKHMNIIGRE